MTRSLLAARERLAFWAQACESARADSAAMLGSARSLTHSGLSATAAAEDRHHGHGRRGRGRARRLDRRSRRDERLLRADDVGARRGAAHRRDDLLRRALSAAAGRAGRRRARAGADAAARRRRRGARLGADGMRSRRAARPGHARAHHADRFDAPRLFDRGEERDGRRPGRQRRSRRPCPGRREALRPLRHGRGRRAER